MYNGHQEANRTCISNVWKAGKLWQSKEISRRTKIRLYESFVLPVLTYGSEYRCLKKDEKRLKTAEISWLRGMIGVTRRDRIRNQVIRDKMKHKQTVLNRIIKKRFVWFGHVSLETKS